MTAPSVGRHWFDPPAPEEPGPGRTAALDVRRAATAAAMDWHCERELLACRFSRATAEAIEQDLYEASRWSTDAARERLFVEPGGTFYGVPVEAIDNTVPYGRAAVRCTWTAVYDDRLQSRPLVRAASHDPAQIRELSAGHWPADLMWVRKVGGRGDWGLEQVRVTPHVAFCGVLSPGWRVLECAWSNKEKIGG